MAHDPLCIYSALYFADNCRMCVVIDRVRSNEREQVTKDIKNIPSYRRILMEDGSWLGLVRREDVINVAMGTPKNGGGGNGA